MNILTRSVGCSLALTAAALVLMRSGEAATVPVTNTNDNFAGSLRQAIGPGSNAGDIIVFQIPTTDPGYNSITGVFTIGLTSAELTINKDLTIDGAGAKIVVRRTSAANFSIFNITAGTVAISKLALADGRSAGATTGGGINHVGGALILNDCTLTGHNGNTGALFIGAGASAAVNNCTLVGNGGLDGAGIRNLGMLSLTNSTITGNGISSPGAAGVRNQGTARVRNSIIASNTGSSGGPDVGGNFISEGYNFIGVGDGSSGFGNAGSQDQVGTIASPANPSLGALQDNGGLTQTRRPLPGSLVIDQGNRGNDSNGQPINTDQRGYARPIDLPPPNAAMGDGSDIGAVETGATQSGPTFTVTNTAEHLGDCTNDDCTLLEALNAANPTPEADTINFAPGLRGTILNTIATNGLFITNPVTINGPGARLLTVSGDNNRRIFYNLAQNVAISGLTLKDGRVQNSSGGAILNDGSLMLINCTIVGGGAVGTGGDGGGLANVASATATLIGCTFSGNFASHFGGGAVFNAGQLTAENCTFTGNSAPSGGAILSVANNGMSLVTLRNCTITNNNATSTGSSTAGGGGYYGEGAVGNSLHHFSNTILAGNHNAVNPDLRGYGTTQGNNLIGNLGQAGSGFSHGVNGDKVGTSAQPLNAQFDAFGQNGGHTDTVSLLSNSPAINAGNDNLAPATDQCGFGRTSVSDIGAFEFNGVPPPVQLASAVSRKTHGSAGVFDINFPLSGNPGVECRTGGANSDYTIVFTFPHTLISVSSASVTSGLGTVSSSGVAFDAHQYVVHLTGVANGQRLTVTLNNVTDSLGFNSGSLPVTLGVLVGDTTGNGSVSAADISQTKSQSGQPASAANFRTDVNVNGAITASDIGQVKAVSGTSLPGANSAEATQNEKNSGEN